MSEKSKKDVAQEDKSTVQTTEAKSEKDTKVKKDWRRLTGYNNTVEILRLLAVGALFLLFLFALVDYFYEGSIGVFLRVICNLTLIAVVIFAVTEVINTPRDESK